MILVQANANFGPGLYEMECCHVPQDENIKPEWKTVGTMSEARSFLGSAVVRWTNFGSTNEIKNIWLNYRGKVYQIAGCINEDFSTNEVWDPKTGKFESISKCLSKRDSQVNFKALLYLY